jgi:hypothetical protein
MQPDDSTGTTPGQIDQAPDLDPASYLDWFTNRFQIVAETAVCCPFCKHVALEGRDPKEADQFLAAMYGCQCACFNTTLFEEPLTQHGWRNRVEPLQPVPTSKEPIDHPPESPAKRPLPAHKSRLKSSEGKDSGQPANAVPVPTLVPADADRQRLEELETTIRQGFETFYKVGLALLEIRDKKLCCLRNFKSFEAYCRQHLRIRRQRGYQLMDAAEVVINLSTQVDSLSTQVDHSASNPGTPNAELVALDPEVQREVWTESDKTAPEGQSPTVKHIRETKARILGTKPVKMLNDSQLTKKVDFSLHRFVERLLQQIDPSQHLATFELISKYGEDRIKHLKAPKLRR